MATENDDWSESEEDTEEESDLLLPLPWLLLLYIISMALIVIGNALIVAIVIIRPYMRTPTNYLVMSLSVSDLIIGVFVIPSR